VPKAKPNFDPVVVSEQDGLRYLHFGTEWIQSAMRVRAPFELVVDYTRDMMAWEESLSDPAHIVQLGLGAGSLSKYCWRKYPRAKITVLEINPDVVACARQLFKLPPDDERLRVITADARAWVGSAKHRASCDVLQVDLYDAEARGPLFDSVAFYRLCRATLRPRGVMTVNVFGNGWGFSDSFANVLEAFDGRCSAMEPCEAGNRVIVAIA
jgi:spermidine synthase